MIFSKITYALYLYCHVICSVKVVMRHFLKNPPHQRRAYAFESITRAASR
mgnify:CR=1 FL=1